MACEQHGEKDKVTILQFIGGMTGSYIQRVLDEKGIHQISGKKQAGGFHEEDA